MVQKCTTIYPLLGYSFISHIQESATCDDYVFPSLLGFAELLLIIDNLLMSITISLCSSQLFDLPGPVAISIFRFRADC